MEGSELDNTTNDQACTIMQFKSIYKNLEVYMFREEKGSYYFSLDPSFREENGDWILDKDDENTLQIDWSKELLIETIKSLRTHKEDLLIFQYSGHGLEDHENPSNMGALCLSSRIEKESIMTLEELKGLLRGNNIDSPVLLILDSCHSGAGVNDYIQGMETFETRFSLNNPNYENYLGLSFLSSFGPAFFSLFDQREGDGKTIYIIAGCSKNQDSFDGLEYDGIENLEHFGLLTYYLLKNLGFDMQTLTPSTAPSRMSLHRLMNRIIDQIPKEYLKLQTPRSTKTSMDLLLTN